MLNIDQITTFSLGNILSVAILVILIGVVIVYRRTVKRGLSLFGASLSFTVKYPAVLIFALLRFILFVLLDIVILTWFFPDMGWRAFLANPLQKLLEMFEHMFFPGLPYGVIILFLFFAVGLLISVATTHYVFARLQQQVEPSPYSINIALQSVPQVLAWSALYAIVYFGIMTKQLFLLPFMVILTFFVTAAIAQGSSNIANSLIRSVQIMRLAFGKTIVFLLIFGLLEFILGVSALQKNLVTPAVVSFLLTVLITIKDIFKALIVDQIDVNLK